MAQSQIYRVARHAPSSHTEFSNEKEPAFLSGWELSASVLLSAGDIQDSAGWPVSEKMPGLRLRVLKEVFSTVSVGVEGQWLAAADCQTAYLDKVAKYSVAGIIKWTLTPDARPKLYLLFAGGVVFNRADWDFTAVPLNQDGALWAVGAGIEGQIARRWILRGEYRLSYEPSAWHNLALRAASNTRHEFAVGLSFLL